MGIKEIIKKNVVDESRRELMDEIVSVYRDSMSFREAYRLVRKHKMIEAIKLLREAGHSFHAAYTTIRVMNQMNILIELDEEDQAREKE